ncbi:CheY-like chemotaxis protein [Deinococcus metalli]|uniref:CheY-like chemotaxis protein n=1 Tax=Deinococcus metalli TaxID=1141878 RepID=A0A7W8KK48_9DEIO|nr:response regulator [Deinococcus metalli]MBB5379303.1 CheY-like chemotaxis protein [Deinococcus metalli]GHF54613.1 response regulator [Deinococcus metalli]
MSDASPARPDITACRVLRVLLVDDNAADRELAREVFQDHGVRVGIETCASGRAALHTLRLPGAVLPDVILLDLNMPGLSGFEVLEALKSDRHLSMLPVVILTTSSDAQDVERAYSLHAASFMTKQLDFGRFVQQVDAFVNFWMHVRTTQWLS